MYYVTRYEQMKQEYERMCENGISSKIVLAIRMPDGTKEIIINDNVYEKIMYIGKRYDGDLKMIGAEIYIEEYMIVKA